jgi:hypothetical protein
MKRKISIGPAIIGLVVLLLILKTIPMNAVKNTDVAENSRIANLKISGNITLKPQNTVFSKVDNAFASGYVKGFYLDIPPFDPRPPIDY